LNSLPWDGVSASYRGRLVRTVRYGDLAAQNSSGSSGRGRKRNECPASLTVAPKSVSDVSVRTGRWGRWRGAEDQGVGSSVHSIPRRLAACRRSRSRRCVARYRVASFTGGPPWRLTASRRSSQPSRSRI
jgi:hypothetical protein